MVPLKWGDALSTILPGAIALVGLRAFIPTIDDWLKQLTVSGSSLLVGGALLVAAAVVGGILEAITRVGWERHILVPLCPPTDALTALGRDPSRLDLYERGVQSSYKAVTAYANTAWAILIVLVQHIHNQGLCSVDNVAIVAIYGLLLYASYVQWTYFVNYQRKVFGDKMLRNDPPPGRRIVFERAIGRVKPGSEGRLLERGGHDVDRPDDRFLVEYEGVRYSVRRDDIREVGE